jgi:hypothetical protein
MRAEEPGTRGEEVAGFETAARARWHGGGARLRWVNMCGALLLALACTSCGGRVDHADTTDDAGSPVEAGAPPTEIPVGDAGGLICSVPVVSMDDSADDCTFSMTCTGVGAPITVDGSVFPQGQGAFIRCLASNGNQLNTLTKLAAAGQPLDCADPATFAPLAIPCSQQ